MVGIEGADDPVAVAPSVGHHLIFVLPVGVGVAGDIEPPTTPAFTVAGGIEEAVDHLGEGIWGVIFEKLGDFRGSGWEASEIVGRSSNEGSSIGLWRHFQAVSGEFFGDEMVDGMGVGGWSAGVNGLESPVRFGGVFFGR